MRNAVDNSLASKGYKKKSIGKADFLITYHVTLDKQTEIQVINSYNNYSSGWGWGWGYGRHNSPYSGFYGNETFVYTYDEGSLIVDIVEPESRELIWREAATGRVNFSHSPEQKRQ